MEFNKFSEFDKALLAQLRAGRSTMSQLDTEASGLRELAWPLSTRGLLSRPVPPPRVISQRLVALEQRGMIHFSATGWVIGRKT